MTAGRIRMLHHHCIDSDIPSTRLVSTHNGVGYGYIGSDAGDVYFDPPALRNLRFDQLRKGMAVEYALENAPYLRASSVVVTAEGKQADAFGNPEDRTAEMPVDAVDASSIESFPASDSPAHWISVAPAAGRRPSGR